MAVGFRIKDKGTCSVAGHTTPTACTTAGGTWSDGVVLIDSSDTTALLQETITKTSLVSGNKTYTTLTNVNAYSVGLCESSDSSAGTWSGVKFGLSNTISGGNPKVSWGMSCYLIPKMFL